MRPARFVIVGVMYVVVGATACGSVTAVNADAAAGSGGGQAGSGGGGTTGSGGSGSGGAVGTGGASGSGGAGGGAGSIGSGGAGGALNVPCSARAPAQGAACARNDLSCQYGDDPRGDRCSTFAKCTQNHWVVTPPDAAACPPFTDAGMCPATASGQQCQEHDSFCSFADGRSCHCTDCVEFPVQHCEGPDIWRCESPSTVTGCPPNAPNLGTACAREGVACSYGCTEDLRKCEGGTWVSAGKNLCPISTRNAKRNVQYLSPADIRAVATDILNVRLARYEYKDLALGGRKHLGFIIEDQPGIPAVDRDHDMVDLYGYTSMLLAATQTQKQEIDALKLQLAVLQAEVAKLTRRKGR